MQKGQIVLLLIIGILVGVIIAGGGFYFGRQTVNSQPQNPVVVSQTSQPTPSPVEETANWQTYKFLDNTGFGYQVKFPTGWRSQAWGGSEADPQPIELAQSFFGTNCAPGKDDTMYIQHFTQQYPMDLIKDLSTNKGAIRMTVKNNYGINFETVTVNMSPIVSNIPDHYAYTPSPKGYFEIFGRGCTEEVDKIFNQVISSLQIFNK